MDDYDDDCCDDDFGDDGDFGDDDFDDSDLDDDWYGADDEESDAVLDDFDDQGVDLTWEEAFFIGGAMGWAYEEGLRKGKKRKPTKRKDDDEN